jgi:hypothetical protein
LAREFVRPSELHEKFNRPQGGLCLFLLGVMGGSWLLSQLPIREYVPWIVAATSATCTGAGALYHPVNRFWFKGAVSGFVAGLCALAVTYSYLDWRLRTTGGIHSAEFILTGLVGALPGVGLYVLLMRDEVVTPEDEPAATLSEPS